MRAFVGLDFGSAFTKAVLLLDDGSILMSLARRKDQHDAEALDRFLDDIERLDAVRVVGLGVVGGSHAPGPFASLNAILASAAGIRLIHPAASSAIEIGAHTLKFIVYDGAGEVRDFSTNEACAAGTGSFLEQQARRLGLSVENLSELAAEARRGATIAGRCSVFAASDMIHLQQKATPLPEIAYGLCLAIARNCMSTLLKGRDVPAPLIVAGGCARNGGIVRAFSEVLGASEVLTSAAPGLEGAIGAAIAARDAAAPPLDLGEMRRTLRALGSGSRSRPTILAPLHAPGGRPPETVASEQQISEGYLGIDVGSVSTDLVLLDRDANVAFSLYLATRGRPAEVLGDALSAFRKRFPAVHVLGCGTTGSGRHLASRLVGADVTKNEITCQLLGAQRYFPDVDTILEIGGQDSKFISVRDGAISDFAMNKVCAAGTGSFLEEQSRDLGVDVFHDFAPRAFAAGAPPDLGSRCTVFMETEVTTALSQGTPVDELCAGLAYSIVRNYLEKVVGARPLGNEIVFQGGVASNRAVVAAFESVLQRPISVHPWNTISGAIGAALAAKERRARAGVASSSFRSFTSEASPRLRSFECRKCANRCEVNVIETGGEKRERAFFGDTCERYTSRGIAESCSVPNLAQEYQDACESLFPSGEGEGLKIGIPRASSLVANLAFWATFWKELGCRPVLSGPSSQEVLALGLKHLSVGVCLPMKLTAGHVHSFRRQDVDLVFVPAVVLFAGEEPQRSFACPYTMAVPFMVGDSGKANVIAPIVTFAGEEEFASGFDPHLGRLGVSRTEVRSAYHVAIAAEAALDERFRSRSQELIDAGGFRHVFAVLGRPYGVFDSYVNMGVFERLRRFGILAIPLRLLPIAMGGEASGSLPWRFPSDMQRASRALQNAEDIHPLVLSSFGCGPDAFALREIETALAGKARLVLELDEHRGEAGLVTRLEAFLDQLEGAAPFVRPRARLSPGTFIPSTPSVVWIPYFADIAYAFSGVFRLKGHDARVLPLPAPEIRALGEKHSLGKECHAYSMIAGDLVNVVTEHAAPETVFYFPGTSIPCLLHEYGNAMEALLDELGAENVRVSSPSGSELVKAIGIDAAERLYLGLFAIELLAKAICQIRPYELEHGATDRLHGENLLRIEASVAGGDVLAALDECLGLLAGIPLSEERGGRPIVGIAGDVYTKVNRVANNELVRWLEQEGLEVWPAPCQIDLLDFGISRQFYRSVASLDLPGLLLHGGLVLRRAVDQWRLRSVIASRVARSEEPGYLEMRRLAAPYMPNEAHELLFLNVAKIVDFAEGGADGVVNAICFGCMVGNASAAIIERIRRDYDSVPIITAVYSGGDDPSRQMVLEAFVSQVKAHHRKRQLAVEPTLLDRWLRIGSDVAGRAWPFSRP